ncbi:MAG: M20/M25/M40 family metallo-hydrolase [Allosphingosinicella sp.]|uniref:M20/M25/M40 family metallo-hydrolase n=1 Tax=Allosphingosinicella sp. TaxID=2823234 RepID=UPI0039315747
MRSAWLLAFALTACAPTVSTAPIAPADRAARWQAHVETLASDAMEGRAAGTPGHERAAAYVANEMRRLGLQSAGTNGYLQPIAFTEQRTDYAASSLSLSGTPVAAPATAVISPRYQLPATFDAPLVFVGYGLHMPSVGHDDFAGVDLRGKIAVFVSGGPAEVAGTLKAHARAQRNTWLAERGAVGAISLTTPGQTESPWESTVRNSTQPGMLFADAGIRDEPPFVSLSWNAAEAERLFAGAPRTFAQVAADADASRPLRSFPLATRLSGRLAVTSRAVASPNVVAKLPGSDPALADEHIVLTAHLDGLGIGRPVNGDSIYNGALDNAAGVAALIDIAAELRRQRPKRSILFVFVTAEERGLLGSRYFARQPTVPRESIVANLNYDMALPLFPLRSVTVLGAEESSIGDAARAVGETMGLPLAPDPFPNRNSFIRSDQYGFIEQGIPAVAFKFGFAANTPEAELERAFRASRYHAPSDDMTTPIFRDDEIRLHDFIAALAMRLANAPERPRWNAGSPFGAAR